MAGTGPRGRGLALGGQQASWGSGRRKNQGGDPEAPSIWGGLPQTRRRIGIRPVLALLV